MLQALANLRGRKTRTTFKYHRGEKHAGFFTLSVKNHAHTRGGHLYPKEIPYKEDVVCLSVASGFVLVRDGGVPLIVGQCPNFGLGFGAGIPRFIKMAWDEYDQVWTLEHGTSMHRMWHALYPGVKRRHDYISESLRVKKVICIETREGRRRWVRGFSAALNHDVQGTAADILKRAQNAVSKEVELNHSVHDELICYADEKEASFVADFVKAAVISAGQYYLKEVPVDAEVRIQDSWREAA